MEELRNKKVMIVDDEEDMLDACKEVLEDIPVQISTQKNPLAALEKLEGEDFHLIISDLKMEEMSGIELLQEVKKISPTTMVCIITAYPTIETAVEAVKLGAYDYITKPFTPDQLILLVQRALRHTSLIQENQFLHNQLEKGYKFHPIIGESSAIKEILQMAEKVASTPVDVLITGESGTGKELVARNIHLLSGRSGKFVPVDCGVIPENLMESQLFGYEKGAFTGAVSSSMGLVEYAHRGTLFLDELGELPPSMQAKLLRVLQEKKFRKIGGREEISVNLRIIAATNRNLEEEVQKGHFREDLFYRINVVHLTIPPLRERKGDTPLLIDHFLPRYIQEFNSPVKGIHKKALEALLIYPWPGNVRELQNTLKRAIIMASGKEILPENLPEKISDSSEELKSPGFSGLKDLMIGDFEKNYLKQILSKHGGEVSSSAEEAEIPLATFYRLLKKYSIDWKGYKG